MVLEQWFESCNAPFPSAFNHDICIKSIPYDSDHDAIYIEAMDASVCTIWPVCYLFVEGELDAALNRKMSAGRQFRKLDDAQEARVIALACSKPPEGRVRWALSLLADKLVELNAVESISGECVRNTLKKRA